MNNGRYIVIVLDSFGIGEMADVPEVRPQDQGSNTALHLIEYEKEKKWPNLLKLGLMNAMDYEVGEFKKSNNAIFGKSELKHFGADSYFGHQEIVGTRPKEPVFEKIQVYLDEIQEDLEENGFIVDRITRGDLQILKVNNSICIGDNMETDLGQAINVVGALDYCGFDMIDEVGHIVRRHVKVPRVIAFGGSGVDIKRIEDNVLVKGDFMGIDAPGSGVYERNYHVNHIGYGVDKTIQFPTILYEIGIENNLYGKAENIIYSPNGTGYNCVDTKETFDALISDLDKYKKGFFLANIQETDLSGHGEDPERYIDVLNIADEMIGQLISKLNDEDILIIMADHGNDPTIGHSKHTRECVPLLIHHNNHKGVTDIGLRKTMADVGQTGADYFGTKIKNGESFLDTILN